MKKILVVFTGGTIGSMATGGSINTASSASFKLLQLFQQNYREPETVQFDTLQPIQILSENLAPAAWEIMITAIESAQPSQYDGIIVTHGTDTLAYTAAVLSFYFHARGFPLLLVSSDYTLANPKGNGLANFICAVEFIRQNISPGVFVPYRNAGQTMQVHRGSRLACSLQLSGNFYSIQGISFMQFDGQDFTPVKPSHNMGKNQHESVNVSDRITLKPQFSSRILMIKPYPGLDYNHFNLDSVDAVLHDLYHSGTACASGQWGKNHSLVEFLNRCQSSNIPVYLAPAYQSENAYQSTLELIEHGAEMIWNTALEAAYVKLMLAYGNFSDREQISNFINQDIAYEHI
jgi:L-asparaginase/Glu-tRNA(Gln) amidotransferase subunit D